MTRHRTLFSKVPVNLPADPAFLKSRSPSQPDNIPVILTLPHPLVSMLCSGAMPTLVLPLRLDGPLGVDHGLKK